MSRASKHRRKTRGHDPHWVAVRNLLSLYGMKMARGMEFGAMVDGKSKGIPLYRLYIGKTGYQRCVGSVASDASLDQWVEAVTKAEKAPDEYLVFWHGAQRWNPGAMSSAIAQMQAQIHKAMALPPWVGVDYETIEHRIIGHIHDEVFYDEAGSLPKIGDDAPRGPPPAPPARRGWRGYTKPAHPGRPVRLSAQGRPPRSLP